MKAKVDLKLLSEELLLRPENEMFANAINSGASFGLFTYSAKDDRPMDYIDLRFATIVVENPDSRGQILEMGLALFVKACGFNWLYYPSKDGFVRTDVVLPTLLEYFKNEFTGFVDYREDILFCVPIIIEDDVCTVLPTQFRMMYEEEPTLPLLEVSHSWPHTDITRLALTGKLHGKFKVLSHQVDRIPNALAFAVAMKASISFVPKTLEDVERIEAEATHPEIEAYSWQGIVHSWAMELLCYSQTGHWLFEDAKVALTYSHMWDDLPAEQQTTEMFLSIMRALYSKPVASAEYRVEGETYPSSILIHQDAETGQLYAPPKCPKVFRISGDWRLFCRVYGIKNYVPTQEQKMAAVRELNLDELEQIRVLLYNRQDASEWTARLGFYPTFNDIGYEMSRQRKALREAQDSNSE